MTNEKQEEAGPVTVQIGVCGSCHALFMLSGDRLTSPCHGADPLAVLATLVIFEDSNVLGRWGPVSPVAPGDWIEEPAPAPAPLEEPPAEEAEEDLESPGINSFLAVIGGIGEFLGGATEEEVKLRDLFLQAGAEPEDASVAVGRLEAVRVLLAALELPREAVPVAPAPPEAESSPTNT